MPDFFWLFGPGQKRRWLFLPALFLVISALWIGLDLPLEPIAQAQTRSGEITAMLYTKLIEDLESQDGKIRIMATNELFRYGKKFLPELKKAGAKQVAPTGVSISNSRRLDMVYSLLEGFPPNPPQALAGYKLDSFGVHFAKGTTPAEAAAFAEKYGLTSAMPFRADTIPNCYYTIPAGKSLPEMLRQILTQEEKVWRVNLNYFEV